MKLLRLFIIVISCFSFIHAVELSLQEKITHLEKEKNLSLGKTIELIHLHIFEGNHLRATQLYQDLYVRKKNMNFLFDAAMVASVADDRLAFRLWNQFFDVPSKSRLGARWDDLGLCFQKSVQSGGLENEELLVKEMRQAYLAKGWGLSKIIIDFYRKNKKLGNDAFSIQVLFVEADLYSSMKFYPEAVSRLEKLHTLSPSDRVKYHLGKTYYKQKMFSSCVDALEKIEMEDWKNFNFHYILSSAYYALDRKRESSIYAIRSKAVITSKKHQTLYDRMVSLVGY